MNNVAWVHDDSLRHWYGEVPAIYVFDDEKLRREQWSLKRIGFIYECLLELPVEIRRGDVVSQVLAFQRQHDAARIITMGSADPHLRQQTGLLQAEVRAQPEFVHIEGKLDLRRFAKYWAKAERALLSADNKR